MTQHNKTSATDKEKIDKTVELITDYGPFDGAHHKQWVLTQALEILLGDDFNAFLINYGDEPYEWDEGIAP